jgi:hypothetical protein
VSAGARRRSTSAAASEILRAERQSAQHWLDTAGEAMAGRQREEKLGLYLGCPRTAEQPRDGAGPQQDGIGVEAASADGGSRQRIERIVLDDAHQPASPGDPPHLGNERRPLRRRDMMHDADRERHVKGLATIGQRLIDDLVADIAAGTPGLLDADGGGIHSRERAEQRTDIGMEQADAGRA